MRSSASLQQGLKPLEDAWSTWNKIIVAKVVGVHPEHNAVDLATDRGGFLRNVAVIGGGGTTETRHNLPHVLPRNPVLESQGLRVIDEYIALNRRDTYAVVAFLNGNVHQPVCWLLPPDFEEGSFGEHNLALDRHAGDAYEAQYVLDNPPDQALRDQLKAGTGTDGDEDDPAAYEYPRQVNWEHVFPDRRRLAKSGDVLGQSPPDFDPAPGGSDHAAPAGLLPLGLETYAKIGYGYDGTDADNSPPKEQISKTMGSSGGGPIGGDWKPVQDFQELPTSARPMAYPDGVEALNRRPLGHAEDGLENFDQDLHPWRRHRENKIRFARGLRANQRWGSFWELSRSGDLRLVAEGLNKNVHPELDDEQDDADPQAALMAQNPNWGSTYMLSRIEERHIAKGEWSVFRKRARYGGQLEGTDVTVADDKESDPVDVRRWGQSRTRTQREWQALSRMAATLGARDTLTLTAGACDDPGTVPGTEWSRADLHLGGDAARYQDRLNWRNPDSCELANIIIKSIRPTLADFGPDKPCRDNKTGGDIHLTTAPMDGHHAGIMFDAMAAGGDAVLTGKATTGNAANVTDGDGATVAFAALSQRHNANASLSAVSGTGGADGDGATSSVTATSGGSDATASVVAKAGANGQGSNATTLIHATSHDDNATVNVTADTTHGGGANVNVTAKPKSGPAKLAFTATSPDGSDVQIASSSPGGGTLGLTADHHVSLRSLAGGVTVHADQALRLNADSLASSIAGDASLTSGGNLAFTGETISHNGPTSVAGPLNVLGLASMAGGLVVSGGLTNSSEAYGQATLSSVSSVIVTHGLSAQPAYVNAILSANLGAVWITGITSTQFTINCASSGSATAYWHAHI